MTSDFELEIAFNNAQCHPLLIDNVSQGNPGGVSCLHKGSGTVRQEFFGDSPETSQTSRDFLETFRGSGGRRVVELSGTGDSRGSIRANHSQLKPLFL